MLAALDDSSRPVTVIAVSHNTRFLESFDSLMVVANNTVKEYGSREELTERKGDFFQMQMAQAGIQTTDKGGIQLSPERLQQVCHRRS